MLSETNVNVFLNSTDGHKIKLEQSYVWMCKTVDQMLKDIGNLTGQDVVVSLNREATKEVLSKILIWCEFHKDGKETFIEKHDLTAWNREFVKTLSDELIVDILKTANFLANESLISVFAKSLACEMQSKTPGEVRKRFKITDNTTRRERLEIFNSNPWARNVDSFTDSYEPLFEEEEKSSYLTVMRQFICRPRRAQKEPPPLSLLPAEILCKILSFIPGISDKMCLELVDANFKNALRTSVAWKNTTELEIQLSKNTLSATDIEMNAILIDRLPLEKLKIVELQSSRPMKENLDEFMPKLGRRKKKLAKISDLTLEVKSEEVFPLILWILTLTATNLKQLELILPFYRDFFHPLLKTPQVKNEEACLDITAQCSQLKKLKIACQNAQKLAITLEGKFLTELEISSPISTEEIEKIGNSLRGKLEKFSFCLKDMEFPDFGCFKSKSWKNLNQLIILTPIFLLEKLPENFVTTLIELDNLNDFRCKFEWNVNRSKLSAENCSKIIFEMVTNLLNSINGRPFAAQIWVDHLVYPLTNLINKSKPLEGIKINRPILSFPLFEIKENDWKIVLSKDYASVILYLVVFGIW